MLDMLDGVAKTRLAPLVVVALGLVSAAACEYRSSVTWEDNSSRIPVPYPREESPSFVLVVGGYDGTDSLASSEIYDVASGAWSSSGSMSSPRREHTTTLLPNGKLLVAGGISITGSPNGTATAEIYDPVTRLFTPTDSMATPRRAHTATLLESGKVLVAGGFDQFAGDAATNLRTAELYDPATNQWSSTGMLVTGRNAHIAVRLTDGRVLVAGGQGPNNATTTSTAEIYDPATESWSAIPSMQNARCCFDATVLANGQVLVAGGSVYTGDDTPVSELYDPVANEWTSTVEPMDAKRRAHALTRLPDGRVLAVSGEESMPALVVLDSSELFDPATGTWSAAGTLNDARAAHSSTLLPDRRVLVTGGRIDASYTPIASNELFDPLSAQWEAGAPLATARANHTATFFFAGSGSALPSATLLGTFPNPEPFLDDEFGNAVAYAGGRLLVGARADNAGADNDVGSAWLFDVPSGSLLEKIENPEPAADDAFGHAVAFTATGLAVSANFDDFGGTNFGTVYAFDPTGTTFTRIPNPSASVDDAPFGYSIAGVGGDVLVSAHLGNTTVADAGVAILMNGATGEVILQLDSPTPSANAQFGQAVGALGASLFVVGAWLDDPDGEIDAGSAHVFDGTGALVQTLVAPPSGPDHLGASVAFLSPTMVVVGAPDDDISSAADAGSVYLFDLAGVPTLTILNPEPAAGERFGSSVAGILGHVVVGCPGCDTGSGRVYVFHGTTGALLLTLENPSPAAGDSFGFALATSGDRLAITAYQDDDSGAADAGSAYVYQLTLP